MNEKWIVTAPGQPEVGSTAAFNLEPNNETRLLKNLQADMADLKKRMQSIMDILKSRQGKSESRREIKNPEFTIDTNNEASCSEDVQLLPGTTLLIGDSILKNVKSRGLETVEIRMIRGAKLTMLGKSQVDDLKNVILYIGGNDVSDGQDLHEMFKQLKDGIESVQRRNPYCEMYVCTICPRADCSVSQANKMLAALCEETGAKLINTFNKFVFGDGSSIPESSDAGSYHSEIGGAERNTHKPEAAYRKDRQRKYAGQRGERTRRHSDNINNKSPRQNVAGIDRERDIPVDQCRTTVPASVDEGGMLEIHIIVLALTGNARNRPTNTIKFNEGISIRNRNQKCANPNACNFDYLLQPTGQPKNIFVRKDRLDKGGGGIIVYISNKLSYVRRYDLESDTLESVWVQITLPRSKSFLVNFVYRPPDSSQNWIDLFETQNNKLGSKDSEVYAQGNFNINYFPDKTNKFNNAKWENLRRKKAVGIIQATPRWSQPCRGSITSQPTIVPDLIRMRQSSDRFVAHRLWIKANDIVDKATYLRDRYVAERLESSELVRFLDDNSTVPGFPSIEVEHYPQLIDRLVEDYRRGSLAAVYIDKVREDEERSNYSPSLDFHFRSLEAKLYPFLCFIKMAFTYRVEIVMPAVSHEEIVNSLQQANTVAERHMRDYKILRDLVHLFHAIQYDYSTSILSSYMNDDTR
ncbi:hypothetical protein MAR_015515 [Mya arenaria]|uniref:Uncharacterized protein n=1 Tax=Mya arenaria TaxID=6604 RepID=A0ABY7FKS6_MYAAR|nr:hypothetical protein MAR_015515 [Mya arenaria]